jgi:hypothetical protein
VVTSDREDREVQAANAAGSQPVVFIHGLWVLAESWRPWTELFTERGYAPVAVDWPGDPASVDEARRNPGVFAGRSVGAAADHIAEVIAGLSRPPVLIGLLVRRPARRDPRRSRVGGGLRVDRPSTRPRHHAATARDAAVVLPGAP